MREFLFIVSIVLIEENHTKSLDILVDIIVYSERKRSSTRLGMVNLHLIVFEINHVLEMLLPDWVIHSLKLAVIVFDNTLFIFFV